MIAYLEAGGWALFALLPLLVVAAAGSVRWRRAHRPGYFRPEGDPR